MKQLNREAIRRMVGDAGVSPGAVVGGGGGGGVSRIDLTGYATESWVNENYLSIEFFSSLFKAYDSASTPNEIVPNGGDTTAITNIKAMFGFWTEQYISALGQGSGGGGGLSLNEPLSSINNSGLSAPGLSQDGMTLVWDNANSKWKYGSTGGGTVMQINTGTGLTGGPITGTGTISINSTYQSYISHGETAYGWGNHAQAGYLTGINATMINNALGFTLSGTAGTTYNLAGIASNAVDGETAYGWGNHAQAGYMAGSTTFWGQSVNNGVVSGSLSSVEDITMSGDMKMSSGKHIYFKNGSSYLNAFEFDGTQIAVGYGFRTAADTQVYGKNVVLFANGSEIVRVTASGLQIGDALLSWDETNKVLNLTNVTTGQVATFEASGGVVSLQ